MHKEAGFAATDFCLPDTQGNVYSLEDFSGGWLLLVFHRHLG